jgi:hypothetical protein
MCALKTSELNKKKEEEIKKTEAKIETKSESKQVLITEVKPEKEESAKSESSEVTKTSVSNPLNELD